jgi:micrococcal nuclease
VDGAGRARTGVRHHGHGLARRRTVVALTAALVAVLAACGEASKGDGPADANAIVVRVVDGDTIVADVRGTEERVRLIGIDTPESVKPDSPVECFGKEASAHAKELLPEGTPVLLVLDVEERDKYDRLLAYAYRAEDRRFINLAMIEDGFANQYTFPPNVAHEEEFRAAASTARSEGTGLWSACKENNPFDG